MSPEAPKPVWQAVIDSFVNCDFNKIVPEERRDDFDQFLRNSVESHGGFMITFPLEHPKGTSVYGVYYSSKDKVISVKEFILDLKGTPQRWGRNFILDPNRTIEEILSLPRWEMPDLNQIPYQT